MKGTYTLGQLASYKMQSAEKHAARRRLLKQARAERSTPWSQAIEKKAGGLIKIGDVIKGLSQREPLMNS
jgi:hypothetical protein